MAEAIKIIKAEHRSIAAILHGLCFLVGEIEGGRRQPDFVLLAAMLRYLKEFPDRVHHPKEDDYLYRAIRRRSEEGAVILDELESEHETGRRLTVELEAALNGYTADISGGLPVFSAKLRAYSDFHWQHMSKEEDVVMPIARKVLLAEDWAEIDNAFLSNRDPLVGVDASEEFRVLFQRIANLAPAPLGFGA
jgi:branched-chain amino acid transport system ATP-binding protein